MSVFSSGARLRAHWAVMEDNRMMDVICLYLSLPVHFSGLDWFSRHAVSTRS